MGINDVLKAIADPTRREILSILRQQPRTAGEIAARFNLAKPSISHHLHQLKEADLIYGERSGTTITYHLNLSVFEEMMASLTTFWKGDHHAPDLQD